MNTQYKQQIIETISDLTKSLNDIDKLTIDGVNDEQLKKSFENIRDVIFKGISKIKRHIETLSTVAEWNRLNVSFFGETNAGKSTIIESLINGDGRSIGEGYKDFTKNINKITYNNINLMDMPGIEGREHTVIKSIRKAVDKSHVVFYVVGTNKEPEENTILKMKNFLKDNVKVYSIINVRGKPTVYKYKKELIDKNTQIVERRVKEKFASLLEGNYSGNIVVNEYLSLLKNSKLQQRFEKDKQKAIEIFGSIDEIKKFSNIQEINKILDNLNNDIQNEIKVSNTYKFLSSLETILSKTLKEKKNFDSFIKETNGLIDKYLDDINNVILKYESEIYASLSVNIERMRIELKKSINNALDNGESESLIKTKLDEVKKKQSKKLNEDISQLLSSMKDEIEGKIKEFKNRMTLKMRFLNLKGNFNLESILESLEMNFKYVLGQIVDIGLSIWGVVIAFAVNPILGVITGVLAIARKIWDWFFADPCKRKREAKSKASKKIDILIGDIENKIKRDLKKELNEVNKNTRKPVIELQKSMRDIKNISLKIDKNIKEIQKTKADLCIMLMKEFLGKDIKFAYIDLKLSKTIIVGFSVNNEVKKYLQKLFRVKNIDLYSSYSEWLGKVASKNRENQIVVRDEFNYRALNVASIYEKNVQFSRITRS